MSSKDDEERTIRTEKMYVHDMHHESGPTTANFNSEVTPVPTSLAFNTDKDLWPDNGNPYDGIEFVEIGKIDDVYVKVDSSMLFACQSYLASTPQPELTSLTKTERAKLVLAGDKVIVQYCEDSGKMIAVWNRENRVGVIHGLDDPAFITKAYINSGSIMLLEGVVTEGMDIDDKGQIIKGMVTCDFKVGVPSTEQVSPVLDQLVPQWSTEEGHEHTLIGGIETFVTTPITGNENEQSREYHRIRDEELVAAAVRRGEAAANNLGEFLFNGQLLSQLTMSQPEHQDPGDNNFMEHFQNYNRNLPPIDIFQRLNFGDGTYQAAALLHIELHPGDRFLRQDDLDNETEEVDSNEEDLVEGDVIESDDDVSDDDDKFDPEV